MFGRDTMLGDDTALKRTRSSWSLRRFATFRGGDYKGRVDPLRTDPLDRVQFIDRSPSTTVSHVVPTRSIASNLLTVPPSTTVSHVVATRLIASNLSPHRRPTSCLRHRASHFACQCAGPLR